jgi:hypothetical protein
MHPSWSLVSISSRIAVASVVAVVPVSVVAIASVVAVASLCFAGVVLVVAAPGSAWGVQEVMLEKDRSLVLLFSVASSTGTGIAVASVVAKLHHFVLQVLFSMWQHQELREVYRKSGWKETDFVTKTVAARQGYSHVLYQTIV